MRGVVWKSVSRFVLSNASRNDALLRCCFVTALGRVHVHSLALAQWEWRQCGVHRHY